MTWKNIETAIDKGARNLVFVTKPTGGTFRMYNYSGNNEVNSMLCLFNLWGKRASYSFDYKDKFRVEGYELPSEIYYFFKSESMHIAFYRLGINLFFEEELEDRK